MNPRYSSVCQPGPRDLSRVWLLRAARSAFMGNLVGGKLVGGKNGSGEEIDRVVLDRRMVPAPVSSNLPGQSSQPVLSLSLVPDNSYPAAPSVLDEATVLDPAVRGTLLRTRSGLGSIQEPSPICAFESSGLFACRSTYRMRGLLSRAPVTGSRSGPTHQRKKRA